MKRIYHGTKYFFLVTYSLIAVFTIALCIGFFAVFLGNEQGTRDTETFDKYFVMITDDPDSSMWDIVKESAAAYGMENDVVVDDLGESFQADYTSEDLMKIAIASKVSGIILNADDSEEVQTLIDRATSEGIPVVTLYNDFSKSSRVSFVGTVNYTLGRDYARQILSSAEYDVFAGRDEIKVSVLMNSTPSEGQSIIYSAIQENVEKNPKIVLKMESIDDDNDFSVESSVRNIFLTQETPDIIVCLSEIETTSCYQAVVDYNMVGEVHILGYYDSLSILQGIDRGIIDSTVKIDAAQMGEYCVKALIDYLDAGYTNQFYSADTRIIDRRNVADELQEERQ